MPRFIPIIIIILLALGFYFLWLPKYYEFEDLRIKVATKTERIRQQEEYFAELDALFNKLAEFKTELAKIDSSLPLDVDSSIPALFNFIKKTTSENGLILKGINLEKISLTQPEKQEKVKKIVFTIAVSGSYSSLKNFLNSVYNNVRLIEVETIRFSSKEVAKGEILTFNLRLRTHFFQQ